MEVMKCSELFKILKSIYPEFDGTTYKNLKATKWSMASIIKTDAFNIIGSIESGKVHVDEIYGCELPKNVNDQTWHIIGDEIGEKYSDKRVIIDLLEYNKFVIGRGHWVYRCRLYIDPSEPPLIKNNWKENLGYGLEKLKLAKDDLTRLIKKEMDRIHSL